MPSFFAIAAMSENRVIGNQGKIPWHIPEDFRWFKHKTMGGTLIMGRKTFESIGKPLPGRQTLVITHQSSPYDVPNCCDLSSLDEALTRLPAPWWICGGGTIYHQMLEKCQYLYLTTVKKQVEGDVLFPDYFPQTHVLDQLVHETAGYHIERWKNRQLTPELALPLESWPFTT